jgi:hypothetical protein
MKRDDYVQYVTEKIVSYYDLPKDKRKQKRLEAKHQRPAWTMRWFGMIPFAMSMWVDQWKRRGK